LEDYKQGKMIILMDDEDRENEGDLIIPAATCTKEDIRKICPGCTMSVDLAFGATASSTVFALSAAEMPT
jgi:3,4-dihydroxy-2-butanone 4-phosphate synthase